MKQTVCALLSAILLLIAGTCISADIMYAEVTKAASIRSGAGYNADKIRLAGIGERFEYLGEENGWYRINCGGTIGFLPKDSCALIKVPEVTPSSVPKEDNSSHVPKITFTDKNITIAPGTRWALKYTLTPGTAQSVLLIWTSSNEAVAKVDQYGVVTGVSKGNARITAASASNSSMKASVNVKVDQFDLVITNPTGNKATYYYTSGRFEVTAQARTGCVSVPAVVSLTMAIVSGGYGSSSFDVEPVKAGTDTITVTAGTVQTVIKVYVSPETFKPIDTHDEAAGDVSAKSSFFTGEIVSFGHYPQDAEGKILTPIEWIVLEVDDVNHRILLISRYILESRSFHTANSSVTWETSSLRSWLNGYFMDLAFSPSEQKNILTVDVDNGPEQGDSRYNSGIGGDTRDRIFLLSFAEAERYFSGRTARKCIPTDYARSQGAFVFKDTGIWWTRSSGKDQYNVIDVNSQGSMTSSLATYASIGVRPALWISLDKSNQ